MSKFNTGKSQISATLALLIGITTLVPLYPFKPATAQLLPQPGNSIPNNSRGINIPAGTRIPVSFDKEKILVSKTETVPLTLQIAANLKDRNGNILVPAGSQIVGQLQPANGGSQFVAQEIIIQNQRYPFYANSQVVTTTETINEGASVGEILGGAAAGAGAAAIIAATTGDNEVDALEVLAGAAVGTLAGWALPTYGVLGGNQNEVISIDPNQDLTLTLQSSLNLASNNNRFRYRSGRTLGLR
jgi:hypothetical protein